MGSSLCCATLCSFQVFGNPYHSYSPLHGSKMLQHVRQQSLRTPKILVLSATGWSRVTLSTDDAKLFDQLAYASLALSPGGGCFLTDDGRQRQEHLFVLDGRQQSVRILINDPATCQLTAKFGGKPKQKEQHDLNPFRIASSIASSIIVTAKELLLGSEGPDLQECVEVGTATIDNIADTAKRGYLPTLRFGQGSSVSGIQIRTDTWYFTPNDDSIAAVRAHNLADAGSSGELKQTGMLA